MSYESIKTKRPLSPHLQVYKPQITSALSIMHRMTGAFLALGSLVLALWLFGAAYQPGLFGALSGFFAWLPGQALLVAWSAAFYYHLCNGIRHLFWDAGKGFALANVTRSGMAVLLAAAGFTVATWLCVWEVL